jgi:hypothetical protein
MKIKAWVVKEPSGIDRLFCDDELGKQAALKWAAELGVEEPILEDVEFSDDEFSEYD